MEKTNGRKEEREKGLFVVVEGCDGVGKGEAERAIIGYEQKLGRAVFDSVAFSIANKKGLPELTDFWNPPSVYYNTVITAEPTYEGIGKVIREEFIANNERSYPSRVQAQAYALNRLVQMKKVVLPAQEHNLRDIQARCCATSLCYQSIIAEDEGKDPKRMRGYILSLEGNKFQLEHAPDLMLILLIKDEEELIRRLKERARTKKDDNSIFDNAKFQARASRLYESDWLRELFESHGTRVEYLDASISPEETREQAIGIYKRFLDERTKQ